MGAFLHPEEMVLSAHVPARDVKGITVSYYNKLRAIGIHGTIFTRRRSMRWDPEAVDLGRVLFQKEPFT